MAKYEIHCTSIYNGTFFIEASDESDAKYKAQSYLDEHNTAPKQFSCGNGSFNLGETTIDYVEFNGMTFDRVVMLMDEDHKWLMYILPTGEHHICVHPTTEDVAYYFHDIQNCDSDYAQSAKTVLATKYWNLALNDKSIQVELFEHDKYDKYCAKVERVNIYRTKDGEIMCLPVIFGEKQEPRAVSSAMWSKMFLSDDIQEYKKYIAAKLFADVIESKEKIELTPIMKQYYDLKKKHPDAILLFRCGDFYETYSDDASKTSELLGITLTKSSNTNDADGNPLCMAGFPHHALDTYLPKLIRAGLRVAICDQLEPPTKKQLTINN